MIKLSSRHTMVLDPQGTAHTLDLDAVLLELRRSFRECGVSEPWIADHIAMVVEEQLGCTPDDPAAMPREQDAHAMIVSLLCASGYEDVARRYRECRNLPAVPPQARDMKPWNRSRIDRILRHLLPLNTRERDDLAARLERNLDQLGLHAVSSELIEQLAIHAVADSARETPAADGSRQGAWLLRGDDWPLQRCSGMTRDLAAQGILAPYPVSRVLPRVRLRLDLVAAAKGAGTPPLAELTLLPTVHRAAAAAAELLRNAVKHLSDIQNAAVPMPPHLVVTGLETVVADFVAPQCARGSRKLREELTLIIQSRLEGDCGANVLITFK